MTFEPEWLTVRTPDGRDLEVVSAGPPDGLLLINQTGTPTAAVAFAPFVEAAAAHSLRTVTFSRAGYAGSTAKPGRRVADVTGDIAAVLEAFGAESFVTMGRSGGGPHALACAALMPGHCLAAASVAGVAPYPAEGLDWLAGMGDENIEEFALALQGEAALVPYLVREAGKLAGVQGSEVAAALGSLVSEVDRAALTGEFAESTAESFRRAVSTGIAGWRDDDLALARPWGFDLVAIDVPVAVWQGGEDRMVPMAHGEWLAMHIPTAERHLYPREGHLSLGESSLDAILDSLVKLADASGSRILPRRNLV